MFSHGSMPDWSVDFDAPHYLFLLVLLPLFWFIGRKSLDALPAWRRRAALFFRLAVAALLIVTLAEPNWLTPFVTFNRYGKRTTLRTMMS